MQHVEGGISGSANKLHLIRMKEAVKKTARPIEQVDVATAPECLKRCVVELVLKPRRGSFKKRQTGRSDRKEPGGELRVNMSANDPRRSSD